MFEAEVRNGCVEVPEQWPEGCKVRIERVAEPIPEEPQNEKIGMDESEWDNSPESLARWTAWMESINADEAIVEFREPDEMDEKFRQYNLDVMRKQIEEYQK